jgi:hypothetical protein
MLQSISREFNIEYKANPSEAKWMSGAVERFHGSLSTVLGHYTREFKTTWDDALPYALFAYRTAVQSRLKASPFQLLYGRLPITDACLRFGADSIVNPVARDAAQRIEQAILVSRRFDELRKDTPLDQIVPGMRIMVRKIEGLKKSLERWAGPYEVLLVHEHNVTYQSHSGREASAHRSQVRPYHTLGNAELSSVVCLLDD